MCEFFSFVSYNNVFYYFNAKDREKRLVPNPDDHERICKYFKINEYKCNKYSYIRGKLKTYDKQYKGDHPKKFIKKLKPKFSELCLAAVQFYGSSIGGVPNKYRTPELCMSSVQQDGSAVYYLTSKQRTRCVCLAAIQQDSWAIDYLNDEQRTPQVCEAAVRQDASAADFLTKEQRKFVEYLL